MKGTSLLPPNPVSIRYTILRHPHIGRDRLMAFQSEHLRRLVEHIYRNVSNYRGFFDRYGLKPHDIRMDQHLGAVPITSRNDFQALAVEEIVV